VKGAKDERALKVALAAYALVFALKMAVFLATGVLPLLAEACHTFSDILVTGLLAAVNSRRATPGGPPVAFMLVSTPEIVLCRRGPCGPGSGFLAFLQLGQ